MEWLVQFGPWLRPAVFTLVSAPMLLEALRGSAITNLNNLALLAAGLGVAALGDDAGAHGLHLSMPGPFALVAVLLFLLWRVGGLGGGAAKYMIALLPWFGPETYLVTVSVGLAVKFGLEKLLGRAEISMVPGVFALGLLSMVLPLLHVHTP